MDISSAFDAVTLRKTGISDLFDIGNMVSAGAAGIIGTIVALGAAIWICVAVLPEKKRKNAKGFLKTLGDLLQS